VDFRPPDPLTCAFQKFPLKSPGLRQIRRRIGQEVTTRLVFIMVTTRLGYCNSLLADLPQAAIDARTTAESTELCSASHSQSHGQQDHVTPALQQLHWLPIQVRVSRVQFKI